MKHSTEFEGYDPVQHSHVHIKFENQVGSQPGHTTVSHGGAFKQCQCQLNNAQTILISISGGVEPRHKWVLKTPQVILLCSWRWKPLNKRDEWKAKSICRCLGFQSIQSLREYWIPGLELRMGDKGIKSFLVWRIYPIIFFILSLFNLS